MSTKGDHSMSDVAYLQSAVNRRMDEGYTPPPETIDKFVSERTYVIGGVEIVPAGVREIAAKHFAEEHETSLTAYRHACAEIELRLAARDIAPLCFVPRNAFAAMCKAKGLIRFQDNADRLPLYINPINWYNISGLRAALVGSGLVGAALVGAAVMVAGASDRLSLTLLSVLTAGLAACAGSVALGWFSRFYERRRQVRSITKEARDNSAGFLRKVVPTPPRSGATHQARFRLPAPPKEVTDVLCKLPYDPHHVLSGSERINLYVACDPGAVLFTPPLHEQLPSLIREKWRQERAARFDPIHYVEHGPAVAILTQYGDWPFERELIDECLRSTWR
jgi:hypothetical protein